ncbi:MAG: UDP-N-acetylmuramate dehydrogenase [Rhodocyclaceae bacterium]|nr:UDP-N-acetylmuramate dehydrogenase [Rhodocyclaceae bacterium]
MASQPKIDSDVPLGPLNTFGLPARARHLARIDSLDDARALLEAGALTGGHQILGGGSNTIFEDDVDALVLRISIRGRRLVAGEHDAWLVEAGGGEDWHGLVRWTLERGWPGLENLSLIPGTVGAAPIQNIGAYGVEMAERFDSLEALDLVTGEFRRFARDECGFGYRDSIFKGARQGRWLIGSVRFRLPREWRPNLGYQDLARELRTLGVAQPEPRQVSDAIVAIRRRKLPDPAQLGNAGSFFKNPVLGADALAEFRARWPEAPAYPQADGSGKLAAGWLIERCGWKGRDLGPVGAYEKQALVLVNRGGARGADVRRTAEAIRSDVRARFGIELEAEPVFVGGSERRRP